MSKVIFLDFDGPMYPERALIIPENMGEESKKMCLKLNLYNYISYWKMDPIAVQMLNNLYNNFYPYDLVISSSWSSPHMHEKNDIQNLLNANGIIAPLHKDWATDKMNKERIQQILDWLKRNPETKDYLIIDDTDSGQELANVKYMKTLNVPKEKIVLASIADGLGMSQYKQIKENLLKW